MAAHTAVVGQSSNSRTVLGQIVEKTAKHHPKRFKNSTPIPSKTTHNYISIYLKTLQSEPIFHLNTLFDRNTQKSAQKYENTSSGRVRWTSNSTPIPSKTTQNSISIYLKTLQNDPIFHLNTLLDRNTKNRSKNTKTPAQEGLGGLQIPPQYPPKRPKIPFQYISRPSKTTQNIQSQYPFRPQHPKIGQKIRKHQLRKGSVRNFLSGPPPAKADIATAILTNVT